MQKHSAFTAFKSPGFGRFVSQPIELPTTGTPNSLEGIDHMA
jgi:hypothetical protein